MLDRQGYVCPNQDDCDGPHSSMGKEQKVVCNRKECKDQDRHMDRHVQVALVVIDQVGD
jgi:hypothetical protein